MADRRHSTIAEDEAQLAALGHSAELQRNFSLISMLGLAFAILNSWTALSASLSLALPSGGATSVLWGLITAGICNLALAASLAEFLSAYPTAGGQYHWVAVVSWKSWVPSLSWITGWVNVAGWIALTASGGLLGSQLIIGAISLFHPDYVSHRWHQFLIYIGYTLAAFVINAYVTRLLSLFNRAALIWSLAGFLIICITLLACASPDYQSGKFVFTNFINQTGWPDGIAWLLGLLQGGFGLTGFDAVSHMIEEIPDPSYKGPIVMIGCVGIGIGTGFIFLMILLFVLADVDNAIESPLGPLIQIYYDATSSKAGTICLLVFSLVCMLFATTGIMTTSSRMTYAFARDGGLPFSRIFSRVDRRFNVPLYSLYLTTGLVIIFGCIFLGSSAAFNAIVSTSVVALTISYALPPAINCLRGRTCLPDDRAFRLPTPLGWFCNLLGIAYAIVTTVLFLFPPALPVTGENMNYCVVAFAIVVLISAFQWLVDGRRTYKGPRIDGASAGDVLGMPPVIADDGQEEKSLEDGQTDGTNGKVTEEKYS